MNNLLVFVLTLLIVSVSSFTPSALFGVRTSVVPVVQTTTTTCFAKHVNDKAAKWAASKRPKKSRLSDIHRKPTSYAIITKPSEYTIDSAAPVLATKPTKTSTTKEE